MKNNFEEKMADIMIGEAVTALLDEDMAISWAALTDRLRMAIENETDEARIRAGLRALEEVRQEMTALSEQTNSKHINSGPAHQKLH